MSHADAKVPRYIIKGDDVCALAEDFPSQLITAFRPCGRSSGRSCSSSCLIRTTSRCGYSLSSSRPSPLPPRERERSACPQPRRPSTLYGRDRSRTPSDKPQGDLSGRAVAKPEGLPSINRAPDHRDPAEHTDDNIPAEKMNQMEMKEK